MVKRQLTAFLPKSHDLAGRDNISIYDLKERPIVFWREKAVPRFYKSLVELCKRHGFEPLITTEHERADDIVMELHTQNILTVMFDKTNVFEGELLDSIVIDDADINVDIGYCYNTYSANPAVQSMISLLESIDLLGY